MEARMEQMAQEIDRLKKEQEQLKATADSLSRSQELN